MKKEHLTYFAVCLGIVVGVLLAFLLAHFKLI